MSDPWQDAHRAKAAADEKKQQTAEHERMVERATANGKLAGKPKPPDKSYVYSGPFWGNKLG